MADSTGKSGKTGTFRPKQKVAKSSPQYELYKTARLWKSLGVNVRDTVKLPSDVKLEDWIAVHVLDFYNTINLLYGSVTEWCSPETCPIMSAGPLYEYHWADEQLHRTLKLSAPHYVDALMTWVEAQLNDPAIFPPVGSGKHYPSDFIPRAQNILKRLFRVYAHLYYAHYSAFVNLQSDAHLNTSFKHFIFFVKEFSLVDQKELRPMADLVDKFEREAATSAAAASQPK